MAKVLEALVRIQGETARHLIAFPVLPRKSDYIILDQSGAFEVLNVIVTKSNGHDDQTVIQPVVIVQPTCAP